MTNRAGGPHSGVEPRASSGLEAPRPGRGLESVTAVGPGGPEAAGPRAGGGPDAGTAPGPGRDGSATEARAGKATAHTTESAAETRAGKARTHAAEARADKEGLARAHPGAEALDGKELEARLAEVTRLWAAAAPRARPKLAAERERLEAALKARLDAIDRVRLA